MLQPGKFKVLWLQTIMVKKPFLPLASEKLSCLPHELTLSSGPLCPQQLEEACMLPGLKLPVRTLTTIATLEPWATTICVDYQSTHVRREQPPRESASEVSTERVNVSLVTSTGVKNFGVWMAVRAEIRAASSQWLWTWCGDTGNTLQELRQTQGFRFLKELGLQKQAGTWN